MKTTRRQLLAATGALAITTALPRAAKAFAPDAGGVTVIDRIDLVDRTRPRTIATRIYLPAALGQYPVVIFSPGFGGDLSMFANSARAWAGRGLVVIVPTHSDSVRVPDAGGNNQLRDLLELRRSEGRAGMRSALVEALENPAWLASRIADIGFIAGLVGAGQGIDPALHTRARRDRLGMAGHSYGAYTTEVMAGASLSIAERNPEPALKAKFAAFMAISGQGPGRLNLANDSFKSITAPLFQITGTRDIGAAGETPEWRLKPYELSPAGKKYAALVQDFTHASFDPASGGEPADTLRGLEIDFWNAWLRDDVAARGRLVNISKRSTPADPVWLRTR